MKLSRDLQWLRPYLRLASPMIPNMKKLEAVKKLSARKDTIPRIHGSTLKCHKGKYTINIYTHYNSVASLCPAKLIKKKYTKIDMLITLAHELAHMRYWNHTPERQILESQLTIIFMVHLKNQGYVSEEHEESRK